MEEIKTQKPKKQKRPSETLALKKLKKRKLKKRKPKRSRGRIPNAELKDYVFQPPEDKVLMLEAALRADFTIQEACVYAQIVRKTYYNWLEKSPEFAERMEHAKHFVFIAAKKVIAENIVNKHSGKDARWLLSRRQKKIYSLRHELTPGDGEPLIPTNTKSDPDGDRLTKLLAKVQRDSERLQGIIKGQATANRGRTRQAKVIDIEPE